MFPKGGKKIKYNELKSRENGVFAGPNVKQMGVIMFLELCFYVVNL